MARSPRKLIFWIACIILVMAVCIASRVDRPPRHSLVEHAYFKCEKCRSLDGGIFGKGPRKTFRGPRARRCLHRWRRTSHEEFKALAAEWHNMDWSAEIPFWSGARDQWGEPAASLCCSIRSNRVHYAQGEDILLDVFLKNQAEAPVTVMHPRVHLSFCGDALPLDITGPDGPCAYQGPVLEPPQPPGRGDFVELGRGEVVGVSSTDRGPIRIVQDHWSMTSGGSYTVRLTFARKSNEYFDYETNKMMPVTAWEGELVSNAIAVYIE